MKNIKFVDIRNNIFIVGKAFLLLFLFYAAFFNESFTSDHVWAYIYSRYEGYIVDHNILHYFAGGRFLAYFTEHLLWLLSKVHISKFKNQFVLQFFLIIMLAYALYELYSLYNRYFVGASQKNWLLAVLSISFINPYFVEAFVYIGVEWGIGIVIAIWATKFFSKERYLLAALFVFGAISIYQSFFALFLIYTTAYLYFESKGKLQGSYLKDYFLMFFITGITALLNILSVKLVVFLGWAESEIKTVSLSISIFDRLKHVFWACFNAVFRCFGMLPKGSLGLIIFFICSVIIICQIKGKASIYNICYNIFIMLMLNLFPFCIFVITETSWAPQRVIWPIFSTLSVLILILSFNYQKNNGERNDCKEKICIYGIYGILGIFFLINIYYTNTVIIDFYMSNKMDEQIIYSIQSEIEKYEEETGMKVNKIAASKAEGAQYFYKNLNLDYISITYNHKAMYDVWSDVELINYLTQSSYQEIEMDTIIYDKYFKGKTWEAYTPDEQLVFIEDTLYWAIF